jgi:CysZ protein
MIALLKNNPLTQFSQGFFYPFRSFRLLMGAPALWRFILIPFCINLVVFSAAVYFGFDFFSDRVVQQIPQGDAWYWSILYYVAWVIAMLLTVVLVFFTFTVVGNLIASPFNDLLSERAEELLTGSGTSEAFSLKGFMADTRRTLATELKKVGLFVLAMGLILPLNLLPGFGNLIYTVLAIALTIFFLVVEYLGIVLSRRRYSFAQQRQFILRRFALMAGFGTGVLALLAIPLLQFLCIPVAVVAATKLWCDLSPPTPQAKTDAVEVSR